MAIDEKRKADRANETVVPGSVQERDDAAGVEPKRARSARRNLIAGIVAACAVCLIVFSAFHLFDRSTADGAGSLLRTTDEQSQKADSAQADGGAEEEPDDRGEKDGEAGEGDQPVQPAQPSDPSSSDAPKQPSDSPGGSPASPSDSSQSGASGDSPSNEAPATATVTVSVSVSSSNADGSVSGGANPTFSQGATAYDALCSTGLSVAASGGYVTSIGGLSEKQFGSSSGWKYSINGVFPMVACTNYVLSDGDAVQWIYVVDGV